MILSRSAVYAITSLVLFTLFYFNPLAAADIEAGIERLVEIGVRLEGARIPRLGSVEVADLVNRGPESENRSRHAVPPISRE